MIAQYFPPDIGGSATRAYNLAKGLFLNGCKVTVVAAFPHYPHGNVPSWYKRKAIVSERFGSARVFCVGVPALLYSNTLNIRRM